MRAIRIDTHGGPDAMRLVDVAPSLPGAGEVLVRHAAAGVNFIDVYHRTGLYPVPLPSGLGLEAAGVVEATGPGVTDFATGDRVTYCSGPIGAYAETNIVPADRLVALPASLPEDVAAASLLKGLTARYLVKRTFPIQPGQTALVWAGAGGVGQILIQWLKHLGAKVLTVVSTPDKAALVEALGADHVILSQDDVAGRVRALTDGRGVDVSYDSVGKDSFAASLDSLAPLGMFVSFGNASGPAPDVKPALLAQKGSLFFTRPSLAHYTRTREMLQESADDLFAVLQSGAVKVAPPARYALSAAADAHRDLESRATTGSLVLIP